MNLKFKLALMLALVCCLACSKFNVVLKEPSADQEWPQAGLNPSRTSAVEQRIKLPLFEVARFKLSAAIDQNLVASRGFVFAPTKDGRVHSIDMAKLEVTGKKKLPKKVPAAVAVSQDALIFAQRYGHRTLSYYDLIENDYRWKAGAGDIAGEPLVQDSSVYVASIYSHVDCYKLADGSLQWQFRTEGQVHTSPALAENILVVVSDRGFVYGLRAENGKKIWQFDLDQPVVASPAIHGAKVFVGTAGKQLFALDLFTGDRLWQMGIKGRIFHAPSVNENLVVFAASDSRLYALDPDTGNLQWTSEALSVIGTTPLLTAGKVIFGSLDHHLYCVNAEDGEVMWRQELNGRVRTNPIVWQNYLIVASEDRYLYVFSHSDTLATY